MVTRVHPLCHVRNSCLDLSLPRGRGQIFWALRGKGVLRQQESSGIPDLGLPRGEGEDGGLD